MGQKFELSGHNLTLENIPQFSRGSGFQFTISKDAFQKVEKAHQYVLSIVASEQVVYGINTGFGSLSSVHIQKEDVNLLQVNLIRSHCVGVGKPLDRTVVRAMMLIQAQSLLKGYSGVQPAVVEMLVAFLNNDITPWVPSKGSVGASGDLAPLSHVAHALMGEGKVYFNHEIQKASDVMDSLGLSPVEFGPKDGLGLINGTHLMAAQAVLAIDEAQYIMDCADHVGALSIDSLRGSIHAFDKDLHQLKPHIGQVASAHNISSLLEGSEILNSHENCDRVQDPYSLRCAAQVHGACRQTLNHAKEVVMTELQSVTDNPIIFAQDKKVVSGGHFHGQALAFVMDYLAMGLAEICSISERRVAKLLNPVFSQLPAFLTNASGLHSGLMIAQYTAASLVSENKILCHPASVDSVPTSNDKEDHVSMGPNAGRKLFEVIDNAYHCLSIEALCASEAMELLRPLKSSTLLEKTQKRIRKHCKKSNEDRYLESEMSAIYDDLRSHSLI
ncbi:MAG: histidine ammonia-lyase [Bdellovibrionales bacterium]|nr:histidine ammonia-lyase [Bdellovibrionales bacterium]